MRLLPPHPDRINAYWHAPHNVGDALTGWLVEKISGKQVRKIPHKWPERKFFVTGSILSIATANTTVWGAGIAWRKDKIDPKTRILAVRGPLARKRALECGAKCPEVYGDPALLMPRLYKPRPKQRWRLGVIPHIVDRHVGHMRYSALPGAHVINVRLPPEDFADEVAGCGAIISSSLHGLIIATAYGVPSRWVEFSGGVVGDGVKFRDFFHTVDWQAPWDPLNLRQNRPVVDELLEGIPTQPPAFNVEALWECCPFPRR